LHRLAEDGKRFRCFTVQPPHQAELQEGPRPGLAAAALHQGCDLIRNSGQTLAIAATLDAERLGVGLTLRAVRHQRVGRLGFGAGQETNHD
jgi:hypothetical protein